MRFTPVPEKKPLPKGKYQFEIARAEDTVSQNSGCEMIKLKVKLYNGGESSEAVVADYLLEALEYKLRHAAYACGAGEKYESGELCAADLEGKTGECLVDIEKDKTGKYQDKNVIKDYVVPEGSGGADDLPF
jgi:hypothetical protein